MFIAKYVMITEKCKKKKERKNPLNKKHIHYLIAMLVFDWYFLNNQLTSL